MENIDQEYKRFLENSMFPQNQDIDSWGLDEALSGYYDSSSPDGAASSKNIVSERNRRNKLNKKLLELRAVVPNISKMDKASIIKDAIEYIQHLQEQEKILEAEIMVLESEMPNNINSSYDLDQELPVLLRSKKKRTDQLYDSVSSRNSPIELLELRVKCMEENTILVSLTCTQRTDTMVQLYEVFESLNLKIITANITCSSGKLMKTVLIQANEEDKDLLQIKIQTAIAARNDPLSPMSI
ncbi:transcription factor bHLH35-like [Vicia villosa]|uniref:transcription factor bHLH35-like n=1 Tax=Vicia villosa TaxID=3911 RepID=UPI00273B3C80|nr:transcription factor bHLH35-like [Vicia villosa]